MNIRIKMLSEKAILPTYGTDFSVGADLYVPKDGGRDIPPHTTVMIPLGFAVEIPDGYAGLVFARSGIATKRGLAPANKVGVIDPDYRGECMVGIHNHSDVAEHVDGGERIAQLAFVPFVRADFDLSDTLSETERAGGGFGSTGQK